MPDRKEDRPTIPDGIEITPEMIEAGESAFEEWNTCGYTPLLLREVYRAMHGARTKADLENPCLPQTGGDEILKRMLQTPHKPHKPDGEKPEKTDKPKPKPRGKNSVRP